MNLLVLSCSFRTAPVSLRERVAFDEMKLTRALKELTTRYSTEAVILSTCNRLEIYLARLDEQPPDVDLIAEFLTEYHPLTVHEIRPHLIEYAGADGIRHLFRVASSLDSMILGEGQIAGQVKKAFELSQKLGSTGPIMNILFPHAIRTAKRTRTETGIAEGHISVSSVAVDFVKQVFDHFQDKTILVIGAGKMGQLTLKHLKSLHPNRILVTNRSPEKAEEVAKGCGGIAVPWDQLDEALTQSDIVLSTTGASEPIMPRRRYDTIRTRRNRGSIAILDIAVPRDFDPRIGNCDDTYLFNIDDLKRISDQTILKRQKHIGHAETIIELETKKFQEDWSRRRNGPIIQKLTQDFDGKRKAVLDNLLGKLNGKLTEEDRKYIEGAFRLFQNQLLHGPIDAIREATHNGTSATLLDAVRKLFRLVDG